MISPTKNQGIQPSGLAKGMDTFMEARQTRNAAIKRAQRLSRVLLGAAAASTLATAIVIHHNTKAIKAGTALLIVAGGTLAGGEASRRRKNDLTAADAAAFNLAFATGFGTRPPATNIALPAANQAP